METLRRALGNGFGNTLPLLIAWLAVLSAMPVSQWAAGHLGLLAGVFLGVLFQVSLVIVFVAQAAGVHRTTLTVLLVAGIAWLFEVLGSKTGIPFGAYHYTEVLQPQLAGVPVLIPLAWLMMLPPAWAVAQRLTGRRSGPAFVAVSALAFSAWDLFLDPQMVHWGLWTWDTPGPYFGVPLVNFAGWLLVSALITALARPPALPGKALLTLYTLTWLVETVGQVVFWRLHGPAAWGFIGMGLFVCLAWRRQSTATDFKAREGDTQDGTVETGAPQFSQAQNRSLDRSPSGCTWQAFPLAFDSQEEIARMQAIRARGAR